MTGRLSDGRNIVVIAALVVGAGAALAFCVWLLRLRTPFKEADGFGAFQRVMRSKDSTYTAARPPSEQPETPHN